MVDVVREYPPGSGINGRPILEDRNRHLTTYDHNRGVWVTWCGQDVPADHMCPTQREIEAWQRPLGNCVVCTYEVPEKRRQAATRAGSRC